MIKITDKTRCCACRACVQACPAGCISMAEDSEGFLYPVADESKCLECGLCDRSCPYNSDRKKRKPLKIISAINNNRETRTQSSSGGIFSLISEKTIEKGGTVFGAVLDSDMSIAHAGISDKNGIAAMRGSKYVQSDTKNTFSMAKEILEKGEPVLYSGTPCQIAGLKSYLKKDYPNLTTCDIVCHGAPSPGIWRKYLSEIQSAGEKGLHGGESKISHVEFRNKDNGWRLYNLAIGNEHGCILKEAVTENSWLKGFLSDLYLRPSCHECMFKGFSSGSDITLSDFWSIKKYMPGMDDNMGTSLVYINSKKGEEILSGTDCTANEIGFLIYPSPVFEPSPWNRKRDMFFKMMSEGKSITEAVQKLTYASESQRHRKKLIRKILRIFQNKRTYKA